jgi:hypothetical protein
MNPALYQCSGCGLPLHPEDIFWRRLGADDPEPMCDECAMWNTEGFTTAAVIAEAVAIVRACQHPIIGGRSQ